MPSKFPRAGRSFDDAITEEDGDDAPSRTYFWESSTMETLPGVTRLSTARIRGPMPSFSGTFAEGTNPPRDPTRRDPDKRSTTRDETAPLD